MVESPLSIGYDEIASEVGHYLGYTRTSGNWTTSQLADINSAIDGGYRRFLSERDWNFLHPTTSIDTEADEYAYDLPDDFASIWSGGFTFGTDTMAGSIRIVGEGIIRRMRSGNTTTGKPMYAAIRPTTHDGTDGQRFEVIFWPTPDAAYTLEYTYRIEATTRLRETTPYPLGGMKHCETVLCVCLAEAERRFGDEIGVMEQGYQLALGRSMRADDAMAPDIIGYSGDRSDSLPFLSLMHQEGGIYYNGELMV